MAAIIPRVQRMGMKIKAVNAQFIKLNTKYFSQTIQTNIIEGTNGEKIITSPHGPVTYPEMPINHYIWADIQNYSNMVALECGITGKKYTYSQVRDYSNYVARSLLNMGFKRGDVIAIVLPNLPDSPIALLGCMEAGIIATTVNPIYTADEIAKQLISSETKAVITSQTILTNVRAAVNATNPNLKIIVINDYAKSVTDGVIPFENLITKGKSLPGVSTGQWSPDDVAILPYSSGTTGLPKGVMLTHRNLVANVQMLKNSISNERCLPADGTFQEILPAVLPMYHIYGMSVVLFSKLSIGCKLITLPKFTPETYIRVLEEHKISFLTVVPPMIMFLSNFEMARKKHIENIKFILSGAAPLSHNDVDKFYNKFQLNSDKVQFCQGYGLTESSPLAFCEITFKKFSSIGKPVSGCDARLVDPLTKKDIVGSGQTGELLIRGPHIMKGYWKNEKATNEIMHGDWLLTGDIAYYDEDVDFYITDRIKELIKVKGFQVAPAELEALLRTHPNVHEAGVIGIPSERYGEVPKAFVVLKKSGTTKAEELHDFMKAKVSDFKAIRGGIEFIDNLPKNPSGKIMRSKLKQDYCK
ncbi:PREDICTED: 4-coumarate--CoA ligase 1-like [Ceratosolen solmsi marchali]|uniref:Luciferin 4-monooxygenase n=1 Tax=Ceratosolen solmsi marchali TaxID=326594 RepID=A0AAJ6VLU8_9HYME|nr:PREDICTED: 4-coumarate--CoA ligase 1-like [Ceratosolen solmsi marchali]